MPGELTILAAALETGHNQLPPFIGKLISQSPDAFLNPKAAQLAEKIRAMQSAGRAVTKEAVEAMYPEEEIFILEVQTAWLPLEAAEDYAQELWNAYESRRAGRIGEDLQKALSDAPGQAKSIISHARAALEELQDDASTLVEKLQARIYTPEARPAEPAPRYSINGVEICTPDNITAVSAPPKAGKTGAMEALIASTFARPGSDCLGFTSENPQGHAVIILDTEQSPFDHWQVMERARRRAGVDKVPAWVQSYCLTGLSTSEIWEAVAMTLKKGAKEFGGIHSMIIDGIADANRDVNDPAEAKNKVAGVIAQAIKYNCPILGIIHMNPGKNDTGKTRGHLGSELERKSETNLRLEKNGSGISTIWADKNRRAPIPKATGPRFMWSEEAGMHISAGNIQTTKDGAERETLTDLASDIFSENPAMRRMDLERAVSTRLTVGAKTAERKVKRMIELEIIKKSVAGLYTPKT